MGINQCTAAKCFKKDGLKGKGKGVVVCHEGVELDQSSLPAGLTKSRQVQKITPYLTSNSI